MAVREMLLSSVMVIVNQKQDILLAFLNWCFPLYPVGSLLLSFTFCSTLREVLVEGLGDGRKSRGWGGSNDLIQTAESGVVG